MLLDGSLDAAMLGSSMPDDRDPQEAANASGRVKDLLSDYTNGFEGMTENTVAIDELVKTQYEMIEVLIGHVAELPAIC